MNLSRSMMIAAVMGAALAVSACSQNVAAPGESTDDTTAELAANAQDERPAFGAMAAQRFQEADKDADGKLTQEEVGASASARFTAADANRDGVLDASELPGLAANTSGRHRGPSMEMLDANQDGKVAAEEFQTHALSRLQHADGDGDGVVTLQEWQARGAGKGMKGCRGGKGGPEGKGGFGGPMIERMVQEADANHDGKVTRAEAEALRGQKFAAADANHDGKLEQSELAAMHGGKGGGMGGDRMGARFAQLDRDGDGAVSKDEAPPRLAAMFDTADANHDAKLTAEELKAAHPMGKGPGGRGMGPGAPEGRGPMAMLDKDGDGAISAQEFAAMPDHWFDVADADKDGAITLDEVRAARPGPMRR